MADAPEQAKGKAKPGTMPIWFAVLGVLVMVISLPTVVLVFFGMLPTIVAFLTDKTAEKYATFCVGGMNFSGLFPYIMELWIIDHSLGAARDLLTNVFNLGIIYSAAAFGWLIFAGIPPVVGAFLTVMSQRRVAHLRTEQRQLIDEWGEEVSHQNQHHGAHGAHGPQGAHGGGGHAPR